MPPAPQGGIVSGVRGAASLQSTARSSARSGIRVNLPARTIVSQIEEEHALVGESAARFRIEVVSEASIRVEPVKHRRGENDILRSGLPEAHKLGDRGSVVHRITCPLAILLREGDEAAAPDRKSTRLNSSHVKISYAVFCLKKKK